MTKRVLLLGGTGAMGVYLVPELLQRGFKLDVTSRSQRQSSDKNLKYIKGDAHDIVFLRQLLDENKYDAIIDFMVYSTEEFAGRYEMLLSKCRQYIYISSYRVYADSEVITEESPRLLDVSTDTNYLKTEEYSLVKARQEDILQGASMNNWTIVRPAITYSKDRFQLGTLEADVVVWRALEGLPVVMPTDMLKRKTTMTWAGDVAKLIAGLVLNRKAFGEDFNVTTSESRTWSEVADVYKDSLGLKVKLVGIEAYIDAIGGEFNRYQVCYDRMFNRVMDNTKVLLATGIKQSDLVSLRDGLRRELMTFAGGAREFGAIDYTKQAKIDKLTRTRINMNRLNPEEVNIYKNINPTMVESMRRKLRIRSRTRNALVRLKHALRVRTRLKSIVRIIRDERESQKIRRADGAIVTLTGYFNYGNMIQRFALQEFLRQNRYNFISYAQEPLVLHGDLADRYVHTFDFVERNIWRKPLEESDNYPAYIVGSDQVWRNWDYSDETTDLGYYFFDFVKSGEAKRIAYAASLGKGTVRGAGISEQFIEYAQPLVDAFDAIAMREDSGVESVKKVWGVEVQQVVDPTMLLTAKDYSKLIRTSAATLDDIDPLFTYVLIGDEGKQRVIEKISAAKKMRVGSIGLEQDGPLPPVEQWLRGFRDAELVVTDSFHGMVFSIINNTDFIVIESEFGGVARLESLLKQLSLESRLVRSKDINTYDPKSIDPIDWSTVNDKLNTLRKVSGDWLLDSLKRN